MKGKVLRLGALVAGGLVIVAAWLFYSGELQYRWGRWAESDNDRIAAIWLYQNAAARGHERAGVAFERLCPPPPVLPQRSLPARDWCLYVATYHDEIGAYRIVGRQALDGDDMPVDVQLGIALLEVAARKGDADALEIVVHSYLGFGPNKDALQNVERGLYWLNEGAKRGDRRSLDLLFRIYYLGRLVPKDRVEYTKWLLLAYAYGDRDLDGLIKNVYRYDLDAAQIAEAERRAKAWLDRYPPRKTSSR